MTINLHKTSTYKDGHKSVEFCTVCGAEGDELLKIKCEDPQKKVDKDRERN